ncbi:MAG: autotransporter outer membrane beta-barrel domain-containing protein [Gammaproteobacteria bacterium]|nr:autotransporter outer membrane beta-barrel domain-containing protein [Gammaproteobacteria bacterium]
MTTNKCLSKASLGMLSLFIFANSAHAAPVSSKTGSLDGGNNIQKFQLGWSCSTCLSPTTISIATTGFSPFLAFADDGTTISTTSTSSITLIPADLTDPSVKTLYVSQAPNITTTLTNGITGYTLLGPAIAAGAEEFTLTVTTGDPTSFYLSEFYSGESYVLISDADQQRAEEAISVINNNVLHKKIDHLRLTYTDHIKTLYKRGQFSLARADYAEKGLNAGDSTTGMAFWFAPTHTSIKNTAMLNNSSHFTGTQNSYLFGADMVVSQNLLVGAVVGYETSETESNDDSETDSDGFILSAYAAYNFASGFTAYGHLGYDSANTDIEDRTIFGALGSFDGDYDSDTHFLGFGVMRSTALENGLTFTMDLGYNYAYTGSDSYQAMLSTDSTINTRMKVKSETISEFLLNTELANPQSWGEYYGTIGAVIDIASNDSDLVDEGGLGLNAGIGARLNVSDNLMGELSYKKDFLTKGHNDYTVSANLRYDF